ncbi:MAG: NAD(+)/NADH kinase [Dehalococcoidia bacterium]|nr:NAD(+)/NADH kinase [Dehalococcoidia bacterium]
MTPNRTDATLALRMKRVGILFRPHVDRAVSLVSSIRHTLESAGIAVWQCSAWDEEAALPLLPDTDLIIGIGGDGTILHCARVTCRAKTPLLGVKLGRLGFITEFGEDEIAGELPRVIAGEGWIEERSMLCATVRGREFLALNDAVVRCTAVRLINVALDVDGERVTTYRSDGVIVATATGSTGYALAAGGPILLPENNGIVIQPISSHLGLRQALVLPGDADIRLVVEGRDGAVLSMDGQVDYPLDSDHRVSVTTSEHKARFLRFRPHEYFYQSLQEKLGGERT